MKIESMDRMRLLVSLIWGESRGESLLGKIAIAWVVKNRALNPRWWGNGWKEVMLKAWQFSCFNLNDPNRSKMEKLAEDPMDEVYRECGWVAVGVLNGDLRDPTGGANHYHAKWTIPYWTKKLNPRCKTKVIGRHIFYKL